MTTHVPAIFYGWHKESHSIKEITQIVQQLLKIKISFPNGTEAHVPEEIIMNNVSIKSCV
jgi:hypothetical protein